MVVDHIYAVLLTCDKVAIVDQEFFYNQDQRWYYDGRYARSSKTNQYMHRVVIDAPKGTLIDHINRDRLDNRKCNLRFSNRIQNFFNSKRKKKRKYSKYMGVTWIERDKKWAARISPNKKAVHLGRFDNELEAAEAYKKAHEKYFGSYL
jgi:hypothetical protein